MTTSDDERTTAPVGAAPGSTYADERPASASEATMSFMVFVEVFSARGGPRGINIRSCLVGSHRSSMRSGAPPPHSSPFQPRPQHVSSTLLCPETVRVGACLWDGVAVLPKEVLALEAPLATTANRRQCVARIAGDARDDDWWANAK